MHLYMYTRTGSLPFHSHTHTTHFSQVWWWLELKITTHKHNVWTCTHTLSIHNSSCLYDLMAKEHEPTFILYHTHAHTQSFLSIHMPRELRHTHSVCSCTYTHMQMHWLHHSSTLLLWLHNHSVMNQLTSRSCVTFQIKLTFLLCAFFNLAPTSRSRFTAIIDPVSFSPVWWAVIWGSCSL